MARRGHAPRPATSASPPSLYRRSQLSGHGTGCAVCATTSFCGGLFGPQSQKLLASDGEVSDGYGIFVPVKASFVRRCLVSFSDLELNNILEASLGVQELIRSADPGRGTGRADAAMFRKWLRIPKLSDQSLSVMPATFALEIRKRADAGDDVERTPGVRALLALGTFTAEDDNQFAGVLADIRANALAPSPDEDQELAGDEDAAEVSMDVVDIVTEHDGAGVANLHTTMSEAGEQLAVELDSAAADARAGFGIKPALSTALEKWHRLRHDAWDEVGVSAPFRKLGLDNLALIRDDILAREAEQREANDHAARERRIGEERAKLEEFRASLPSLERLAAFDEPTYGGPLDSLRHQILVLEATLDELESESGGASAGIATAKGGEVIDPAAGSVMQSPEDAVVSDPPTAIAQDDSAAATGDPDSPPAVDFVPPAAEAVADPDAEPESDPEPVAADDVAEEVAGASAPPAASAASHPERENGGDLSEVEKAVDVCDIEADLAAHVGKGRFGAAWTIAHTAGVAAAEVDLYRAATAAFHSAPGGIDPSEALTNVTTLVATTAFSSPQSARVAMAAALRSALAAGWIPRSEVESLTRQAGVDDQWRTLQNAAVEAVDRHYQHLQNFGTQFGPTADEVRDRARGERAQLNQLRTKFVRGDKVLMYLLRSQEPLGAAIAAVEADTHGEARRAALTEVLAPLQSPDTLIDAADTEVSSPQQRRRESIIKGARAVLNKAIETVAQVVNDALNAEVAAGADSRAAVTQEAHAKLIGAATRLQEATDDRTAKLPGDLALQQLVSWILNPTTSPYATIVEALLSEALPAVSAPRDLAGLPTAAAECSAVIADLATPLPPDTLFHIYAKRGDLQQARCAAHQQPDLLGGLPEYQERWARQLRAEVSALRADIGRTFADAYSEGDHSDAEALLVEPENYLGDRFDLQMATLQALREELDARRDVSADRLRERVTNEISRSADRERIVGLIDDKDLVAANELFSLALTGPLPDRAVPDDATTFGARVFADFMRDLGSTTAASGKVREVMDHMWECAHPDGAEPVDSEQARLNKWDHLSARRLQGAQRKQVFTSILSELGLNLRGELTPSATPGSSNYTLTRVTATPTDGSLVPGLGSQAAHYVVAVTKDPNVLLRQVLVSAFPDNSGPNIVLFDGVLSIEQRRNCLTVCRKHQTSAIVVDHAVAAHVAVRHRRSFKAAQQLTLPFTCFTHYTLVSGHVPDEVFVGRAAEQRQLAARDGSLFVYGGRQLGKTALLKRTAREFNAVEDQHAIYIDLSVHGIGKWAESQQLWQVLFNEVVKIGNIQERPNPNVRTADPVKRVITNWLAGKETRRLLVLLDEADAFLEKESVPGAEGFKHIQPLRGLFFDSGGRFNRCSRAFTVYNASRTSRTHH